MRQARSSIFSPVWLVALGIALSCQSALADEYTEVSQLTRTGKLEAALSRAESFLSAQPRDPQMRFLLGVVQRDAGKTDEAIGTFTQLTQDYPELPEPYNNLAALYAAQKQLDKALAALQMALRINPAYGTAHENLGDLYVKLAEQSYNQALKLSPASKSSLEPKLTLTRQLLAAKAPCKGADTPCARVP